MSQIFRKMTVVIRAVTTFEIGTLMSKFDIIEFESRFESLLIFYLTLIFFCPFVCVFFVFLSRSTKGKGLLGVARRKPKLLLRGKKIPFSGQFSRDYDLCQTQNVHKLSFRAVFFLKFFNF